MPSQTTPQANRIRLLTEHIAREFRPERLFPAVTAGLINGVLVISVEISFAAMIFGGDLSVYVSKGIGLTLFGCFVIGMIVTLTSSYPGTVAIVQDGPVAVLGLMAASIAAGMPVAAAEGATFYTIVTAIALSTCLSGVLFLVMGRFRLGNMVRFIPYPVVGGFLAGIGWLLFQGGIGVMTGVSLSPSGLDLLFQAGVLVKWLPGLAFGIILLLATKRFRHFLLMPGMILLSIGLFYSVLILTGNSIADAGAGGWLMGPFPAGALWQPPPLSALAHVEWGLIFGQIGNMVTVFIISVISLLLYASGLELTVRRDLDLDRELISTGWANLLAFFGASPTGYMAFSMSVLGHKIGSDSRLVGLCCAGLCGAVMLFGASTLSFFPKAVAGGILLYVGLDFLWEWLYEGWFKLPKTDYFLLILIVVVIAVVGYMEGVAVGVMVAAILFIIKYSRINVVKYVLSGRSYRSNVNRAATHRWLLNQKGEQLQVLKLQGFLFFGTANNLLAQVRKRAEDPELVPLRYVVFDFRHVSGLDSSALNSLGRMKQLAESREITLVFTHLSSSLQSQFERGGFPRDGDGAYKFFPDLDHGVEWCEDLILGSEMKALQEKKDGHLREHTDVIFESTFDEMMETLKQQEDFERLVHRMKGYVETLTLDVHSCLIRQGEPVTGLYFVEAGQVTAYIENADGNKVRLRTLGMGSIVGELGIYGGASATASVIATRESRIYYLSRDRLRQIEENDPEMAADLHKSIARLLGERLADATRTIEALLEH